MATSNAMRFTLTVKITTLCVLVCVVSAGLTGYVSVRAASISLLEQEGLALDAIRQSRQRSVERYFYIVREQVANLAQHQTTAEALKQFSESFDSLQSRIDAADLGPDVYVELV